METWGFEIFDDDIAFDVKATFEDYVDSGMPMDEVTERIMEDFEDAVNDPDEYPVIILSLALLQLKEDDVVENIRESALDIIESGDLLSAWEYADPDDLQEKKKFLKQLKSKLLK